MRKNLAATAILMSALVSGVSQAAVSTHTYAVTGSNFTSSAGTPPFAAITESITINFDTAILVSQSSAGITQNTSTIIPSSTLVYTYVPSSDQLLIGGLAATVATSDPASTDFALVITNASAANFGVSALSYSAGTNAVFTAQTFAQVTATPEPASIIVIATTLAVFGLVRHRRRS